MASICGSICLYYMCICCGYLFVLFDVRPLKLSWKRPEQQMATKQVTSACPTGTSWRQCNKEERMQLHTCWNLNESWCWIRGHLSWKDVSIHTIDLDIFIHRLSVRVLDSQSSRFTYDSLLTNRICKKNDFLRHRQQLFFTSTTKRSSDLKWLISTCPTPWASRPLRPVWLATHVELRHTWRRGPMLS